MKRYLQILVVVLTGFSCSVEQPEKVLKVDVLENPSIEGSRYPFFAQNEGLNPIMSWFSPVEDGYKIEYARYQNGRWSSPEIIAESDSFFVNWADFPSIVTFDGDPVAAHWLKKIEGGTYAYNVEIAFRNADGSWTEPIVPHTDGTSTEHGFVSMVALNRDQVFAVWLDGRNMTGMGHGEMNPKADKVDLSTAMTLRSGIVHRDGSVTDEHEIDSAVCECCQTSLTRVNENMVVVYRNRTEHEIRDIYYSMYNLDTGEWNPPQSLADDGWEIGGCPVNGPQISANGNSVVAVWFTGAEDQSRSFMAQSVDGGLTFGEAEQIDDGSSMGRVGVLSTVEGSTWISWVSAGENPAKIYIRKVGADGPDGDAYEVAQIDASRGSGFPKMAETEMGILMSWTSPRPISKINTILIHVDK